MRGVFTKLVKTGGIVGGVLRPFPVRPGLTRQAYLFYPNMTLDTILVCWLCHRPSVLRMSLVVDADLGCPRYWCRHCLQPRRFYKVLLRRLRELKAPDAVSNPVERALVESLLAAGVPDPNSATEERPLARVRLAA